MIPEYIPNTDAERLEITKRYQIDIERARQIKIKFNEELSINAKNVKQTDCLETNKKFRVILTTEGFIIESSVFVNRFWLFGEKKWSNWNRVITQVFSSQEAACEYITKLKKPIICEIQ